MIARLRGIVLESGVGEVIVDIRGVGYRLFVPDSTLRNLPLPGEEIVLHTHTYVRDDAIHLYGFATDAEKRLFETVVGVSGIGPRLALSILSHVTVDGFVRAVLTDNHSVLTKIPGIGKKIASRIVLELKDTFKGDLWSHLLTSGANEPVDFPAGGTDGSAGALVDALDALIALGYSEDEAKQAVDSIASTLDPTGLEVEKVITMALGKLDRVG